jgi:hypothetical protein
MNDPATPRDRRPLLSLLAVLLISVAAACASEGEDGGGSWTLGPTVAPASDAPEVSAGPSGSLPVGSGAPVGSVGPDTSSAPQPSSAP